MTHKEVMAKLFDFNATTYYAWKKQDRPIINLIDIYFTKEDLEEFLKYGQITKFELLNMIDYQEQILEFVGILGEIALTDKSESEKFQMLEYFSFAAANIRSLSAENSSKSDFVSELIGSYDQFVLKRLFNSKLLQTLILCVQKKYPNHDSYEAVLFHLYFNDFLPLVKVCFDKNKKEYLREATIFCIYYNLYVYRRKLLMFDNVFSDFDFDNFTFKEFEEKIEKIKYPDREAFLGKDWVSVK